MYQADLGDENPLEKFNQENYFSISKTINKFVIDFEDIKNCFSYTSNIHNKKQALFYIDQYELRTQSQSNIFQITLDLESSYEISVISLEYAIRLEGEFAYQFLILNYDVIQKYVSETTNIPHQFYHLYKIILQRAFNGVYQIEQGDFDKVDKVTFLYNQLFKRMRNLISENKHQEFSIILSVFVDLFDLILLKPCYNKYKENFRSSIFIIRTLKSSLTKALKELINYLTRVPLFIQIQIIRFLLSSFKFKLIKQLRDKDYQEQLLFDVFPEIKGEIHLVYQTHIRIMQICRQNNLSQFQSQILISSSYLLEIMTESQKQIQLITEVFQIFKDFDLIYYRNNLSFLVAKIFQIDKDISLFMHQTVLDNYLKTDQQLFELDYYVIHQICQRLKQNHFEEFFLKNQNLEKIFSSNNVYKINFFIKLLLEYSINDEIKNFHQTYKIIRGVYCDKFQDIEFENFIRLEIVFKLLYENDNLQLIDVLSSQREETQNLAINLLEMIYSNQKKNNNQNLVKIVQQIKDFIFQFGRKLEQENFDIKMSCWIFELIRKFNIIYNEERSESYNKSLQILMKNFCFNAQDSLSEREDLQAKFRVDVDNGKIYNLQSYQFITSILKEQQILYQIDNQKLIQITDHNLQYIFSKDFQKQVTFEELTGINDPVQINLSLMIKSGSVVLNVIVTNISGILIKELYINFAVKNFEEVIIKKSIEINTFFAKQTKNYFYELQIEQLGNYQVDFFAYLKNIEKVNNCLIDPNKNDENQKIDKLVTKEIDLDNNLLLDTEKSHFSFHYFFCKLQGQQTFSQFFSSKTIYKKSYHIYQDNKNKEINQFIESLEFKGFSQHYNSYIHVNGEVYFFAKMTDQNGKVVLKIRSDNEELMEMIDEIFEIFFTRAKKCNQEIIQGHMLFGMAESTPVQMTICPRVKERCCTIGDEIRISKFFQESTMSILGQHTDKSLTVFENIMKIFDRLKELDPLDMSLKYRIRKVVPYIQEMCVRNIRDETKQDYDEFVRYYDDTLAHSYEKYSMAQITPKKKLDLIDSEMDNLGERHWGVEYNKADMEFLKEYKSKIDFEKSMIQLTTMDCKKRDTNFWKDFIMINQVKTEKCFQIYKKMLIFDNSKMAMYLGNLKKSINQLQQLRAGYFCSLCNADEQKFFDPSTKQISVSQEFCKDLIVNGQTVLKFMNVVLVEYLEFLFEYRYCYESPAEQHLKDDLLQKYKRRIPLINDCLQTIKLKENPGENKEDQYDINMQDLISKCWFICESFQFNKISNLFDGEFEMLSLALMEMVSFERKTFQNLEEMKDIYKYNEEKIGNVNGYIMEPINPSYGVSNKYFFDTRERQELYGKKRTIDQLDPMLLKMMRKIFVKKGLTKGVKMIDEYQEELAKIKESKYFKRDLFRTAGQIEAQKILAQYNWSNNTDTTGSYMSKGFSVPRKLSLDQGDKKLKKAHSQCGRRNEDQTNEYYYCLKQQLHSKEKMLNACDIYDNKSSKYRICKNSIKGSLEFMCFDQDPHSEKFSNCRKQRKLSHSYLCRNIDPIDKKFKECQKTVKNSSQYKCRRSIENKLDYDVCVSQKNETKIRKLQDKYAQKCTKYSDQQDAYQICMKDFQTNSGFLCKDFVKNNQKFYECVSQENKRKLKDEEKLQLKNRKLDDEEIEGDDDDEDEKVPIVDHKNKIYKEIKNSPIRQYKQYIQAEGMNPFDDYNTLQINVDISDIISKHYTRTEDISNDVMQKYLTVTNKKVNQFNNTIYEKIIDKKDFKQISQEYREKVAKLKKASNLKERVQLKKELKEMEADLFRTYGSIPSDIDKRDYLSEQQSKRKNFTGETVTNNDHIDDPNYEGTFGGLNDFFVGMFGPQFNFCLLNNKNEINRQSGKLLKY